MAPKKRPRLVDSLADPDSALAKLLLQRWSWGEISAHEVWQTADAALRDQEALLTSLGLNLNFASTSLSTLAKIGTEGKYPGSMRRDLTSALGEPPIPEVSWCRSPMHITKPLPGEPSIQEVDIAVLLPHEMFAYMYKFERDAFNSRLLGGDPDGLVSFWSELQKRKDPRLAGHPMCAVRGWKSRSIPIAWHGDGVPAISSGKGNCKTFEVDSWSSILAGGSSIEIKVYAFGYMTHNKNGEESMLPIWRKVMWSLHWAFLGKWPTVDEHGVRYKATSEEGKRANSPLAGGYFLSLYTLKQDLEHLAGEYHLADYRTNSPCELCPCTRAKNDWENNFHNFNDDALWMTKVFTAAEWNASHDSPHYLLQEAHMTCLNVEPDEAHILHLGVSQYCLGSVLWQLCYSCESLDGEADANCEVVWQGVREVYREQRTSTQMGNLLIKSFVSPTKWSDEYPRLRAKAAETKDIVYPIFRVWERFRSLRDPDHDRVSLMLRALVDLQAILHDNRHLPMLPIAHALKFRDLVRGFLKDYALLANSADREKASLYALVPKHHWLWHLADRALFINPRRSCCLLDEDYVGKIKLVVASCAFGTPLHNVQSKAAEQYRYGFSSHIDLATLDCSKAYGCDRQVLHVLVSHCLQAILLAKIDCSEPCACDRRVPFMCIVMWSSTTCYSCSLLLLRDLTPALFTMRLLSNRVVVVVTRGNGDRQ